MGSVPEAAALDEQSSAVQGWEGKLPKGRVHPDPASALWGRGVEKVHWRENGLSY